MITTRQYIVFLLDNRQYALPVNIVERIIPNIFITPLPKAPSVVKGIINIGGEILPVFNIRERFKLRNLEINLDEKLIIANTSKRKVALLVDNVENIIEIKEDNIIPAEEIISNMEYVDGVIKLKNDLILIHNLEKFLSLDNFKLSN